MEYEKTLIDKDGEKFPYSENIDKDGYLYEISIVWKKRDAEIGILNKGCHIAFDDGELVDTNIIPELLFPGKSRLNERELLFILDILEKTNIEGKSYTKEDMDKLYKQYLKEREDNHIDPGE